MGLNDISLKGNALTHSFKSLVISSIYLLSQAPDRKRKRFLRQKNDLIIYGIYRARTNISPFCGQVYSIVISTVSFFIGGSLITND